MNAVIDQFDLFETTVKEATPTLIPRYPDNLKIPHAQIWFCEKCSYIPKLCKCMVTIDEANELKSDIDKHVGEAT